MRNQGFTLIEMLIVIGLVAIIGGLTLATNLDSYRGYSFRNDRDTLVHTLERARSQAINNICDGGSCTGGVAHGVHFATDKYTIFQGSTYNPSDSVNEDIKINPAITVIGPSDLVFTQLSGNVTTTPVNNWNITVSDNLTHSSVITLNGEGQIKWTN